VTFLPDVNVLIALIDPTHIHHDTAHRWFALEGAEGWATCPLTENGVVRIVGHPNYPNTPGAPSIVADILGQFCRHVRHAFWPDHISLLDTTRLLLKNLLGHKQVTDSYLVALAVAHGGKLVTLDKRLSVHAVVGGVNGLEVI
jgi:hypothetical protein